MAGFSAEDIEKVRQANDIVDVFSERVPLKPRGNQFWCCCPFHDEKTPSCKVDPSTQLFHCFGCGEGGDIFTFVMKLDDVSFPDAVRYLADRGGVHIEEQGGSPAPRGLKARLAAVCSEAADYYHSVLMRAQSQGAAAARDYLSHRGLGGDIPNMWNLGYAPGRGQLVRHLSQKGFTPKEMIDANVAVERSDRTNDRFYNRVMFPIYDVKGQCIAFGGRVIGEGEPKYLNSQETPLFHKSEVLYGLNAAKAEISACGTAIVCEGYTDVIAMHEAGITNAVATLGTALTRKHIRVLSRYAKHRIVYLFDGDAAGQRAADRAVSFIDESMTPEAGKHRVDLVAVTLPEGKDPAEFLAAYGAQAMHSEIDAHAKPLIQYGIDRRIATCDLSTPEGRAQALADSLAVLAPIKDSLLAQDYAVHIASRVQMREDLVLAELARIPVPRTGGEQSSGQMRASGQRAPRQTNTSGQMRTSGTQTYARRAPTPRNAMGQGAVSESRLNRVRLERELVRIVAQNPELGMSHADSLAQISWHDRPSGVIADAILDVLAQNPQATTGEIITHARAALPGSERILSGGIVSDMDARARADFVAEELDIDDREDMVATLRSQLSASQDPQEQEMLFQGISSMQRDLQELKRVHAKRTATL